MDTTTLPTPFTDGRVILRLPTEDDIDWIVACCRLPDVQRFTTVPSPYTRQDARGFVASSRDGLDEGARVNVVVELDDQRIGVVGLGIDGRDQRGIVGYWSDAAGRGRGAITDAVRLLCRFAFEELDLARLELDAAASNEASNAVARRCGFTHEGTRRSAMILRATPAEPAIRDDANDWGLLPGELR